MEDDVGYLHIENLYKNQTILLFKEVYALEKIHGTSAHISWKDGQLHFFSGGEKHTNFVKLFDQEALAAGMADLGHMEVVIFGEAYGGSQQGQSWRYGKALKFVAFDVKIGEHWLDVPNAEQVSRRLGLDFVHWKKVSTDIEALNAERDAPSEQARRNGVEGDQPREGVVLRPLVEFRMNNSDRVISKHKRDAERETHTARKVDDPAKMQVLQEAEAIALEWVTETRLDHVLDKLPQGIGVEATGQVIAAMIEDVTREASGEIVDSKEARKAVGARAAKMFRDRFKAALQASG
jgi:hypothetical protein